MLMPRLWMNSSVNCAISANCLVSTLETVILKLLLTLGWHSFRNQGNETAIGPVSYLVKHPGHVLASQPHGKTEIGDYYLRY
jgi:hypothetical protein